ncbi:MAG TPA: hypothetical protein V6C96_01505 [Vampirovibrionales bacterium]
MNKGNIRDCKRYLKLLEDKQTDLNTNAFLEREIRASIFDSWLKHNISRNLYRNFVGVIK